MGIDSVASELDWKWLIEVVVEEMVVEVAVEMIEVVEGLEVDRVHVEEDEAEIAIGVAGTQDKHPTARDTP